MVILNEGRTNKTHVLLFKTILYLQFLSAAN
jgi:hypothetical protein